MRGVGISLLLISALLYSFVLIKNEKRKIAQLKDMCALVLYIRRNIDAFMTPVNEILDSFEGYGDAFSEYMTAAKKYGLPYASDQCQLIQNGEVVRIFTDFTKKIGSGYKADELNLCQYCYAQLEDCLKRETEDSLKKTTMYKTLPIMSALSVILIFL